MPEGAAATPGLGHNKPDAIVEIELRLFNRIARLAGGGARRRLTLAPGATVGDVVAALGVPAHEVFLVFVNGRDITRDMVGRPVRLGRELEPGDVLAFSGPVPYSWGYGLPVV